MVCFLTTHSSEFYVNSFTTHICIWIPVCDLSLNFPYVSFELKRAYNHSLDSSRSSISLKYRYLHSINAISSSSSLHKCLPLGCSAEFSLIRIFRKTFFLFLKAITQYYPDFFTSTFFKLNNVNEYLGSHSYTKLISFNFQKIRKVSLTKLISQHLIKQMPLNFPIKNSIQYFSSTLSFFNLN